MTTDAGYAQYLQSPALYVSSADAVMAGRWPTQAIESEILSALANEADAVVEAARQLGFLGPVTGADEHIVTGQWRSLLGQVVTLTSDRLDYAGGVTCFVIEADEQRVAGSTVLLVLRKM